MVCREAADANDHRHILDWIASVVVIVVIVDDDDDGIYDDAVIGTLSQRQLIFYGIES